MLVGVDVHGAFQSGIDFNLLKRQGYSFAAMKFTQGTSFTAPSVDTWPRMIRDAGLVLGGYHWINHGQAVQQAEFFFNTLERTKALVPGLPTLIQLDCEDNATYTDVLQWKDRWNQLSGNHPFLLYTGKWWWAPSDGSRNWNGPNVTPFLWHSQYLVADTDTIQDDPFVFAARIPSSWWIPGYGAWNRATFIQMTSKGDAGSLGNNVDLNAFQGTMQNLLALTGTVHQPEAVSDMKVFTWNKGMWVSGGNARRSIPDGGALTDIYESGGVNLGDRSTWSQERIDKCFGPDQDTLKGQAGPPGPATYVPHTHTGDEGTPTAKG